ncbi:MAG: hypothetical protein K2X87_30730 [Gemmataceae bacterium]|nr:hypothetical protein [Gemmataceae bacterium]
MPPPHFDQASRLAARLDPTGFLGWLFDLHPAAVGFAGWLDTRGVERVGDTVARLDDPAGGGPPWAVAVEFQTEPDPTMFGRLLAYLSDIWTHLRPDPERGSRFEVGAAVVNLTGNGLASREMRRSAAGLVTHLGVVERNLSRENADNTMGRVEAGDWSRCVLPWVPLMAGGGRPERSTAGSKWPRPSRTTDPGRNTRPWPWSSPRPPAGRTNGPPRWRAGT